MFRGLSPGGRQLVFTSRTIIGTCPRAAEATGSVVRLGDRAIPPRRCRRPGGRWAVLASRGPRPKDWAITIRRRWGPLDYARAARRPEIECMARRRWPAYAPTARRKPSGRRRNTRSTSPLRAAGAREEELPYNSIIGLTPCRGPALQVLDRQRPAGVVLPDRRGRPACGLCLRYNTNLRPIRAILDLIRPGRHPEDLAIA
jgi:hypothetical protein